MPRDKEDMETHHEWRAEMWKRRNEMINSLSEKELRAFIKGYMMGERMVFRRLRRMNRCGCGSCRCGENSCGCEEK